MDLSQIVTAQAAGWNGILGTRGSLMLDLVLLAMFAVVPVMAWSMWQVRAYKRYELHRRVQVGLGFVLGLTIIAFAVDMRLHGWRARAEPSRFWRDGALNDAIDVSLVLHLACAVPTAFLWVFVIVQALRHFDRPTQPNAYSPRHRFWARLAAVEMVLTAVTGWGFYYLAFVA
jgi:uncharacterized membrane protein YozB (DUF420 family)